MKNPSFSRLMSGALMFAVASSASRAGEAGTPKDPSPLPPVPPAADALSVSDADLNKVEFAPAKKFPWAGKALPVKNQPAKSKDGNTPAAGSAAPDMNSADMIIKSNGPFQREEKSDGPPGSPPNKQYMIITKDVEIEMVQSQSVLRGQSVQVVRDMKTNDTELIEAKGGVQMVSPERVGRGEMVRFDMKKGPNGDFIKNQFLLVGDLPKQKKATLWLKKDPKDPSKKDVIQAYRFVRDEVADTFRASGAPSAVLTTEAPPGTPPAGTSPGGASGLNLSGAGRVSMNCEAEMFFDGATGKLKLSRNVVLIKEGANPGEGVRMSSDDAIITMSMPQPGSAGQATPESGGAFSGEMKLMECFGNVEIKTGTRTILCDKMKLDIESNFIFMEMNNPADSVNIYDQKTAEGGTITIVPKPLTMNLKTNDILDAGALKMKMYTGVAASNRGNGPTQAEVMKQAPASDPKSKSGGLLGGIPGKPK